MSTYVTVGGVAGGATAAARLRRLDEQAQIIVLERGKYVSFANCGLPYYVGEVIPQRESLLVSTPEKLKGELNLDVRTEHEVMAVDRGAKEVEVYDRRNGRRYRLAYDKLILSPGARPIRPKLPGAELPGVYTLHDIPDAEAIKAAVDELAERGGGRFRPPSALVVGGGFIGLEMVENLSARGLRVTLVEMMEQVLLPLDFEMAAILHHHLRAKGVRLGLGDGLKAIEPGAEGRLVAELSGGKRVEADLLILAIGVRPESELARAAGLALGPQGHVLVNEFMQTSDPAIYAVGDVVQVINPLTGVPAAIPLAGPANRQGRIAADHIVGRKAAYRGTLGTSIVKVFELTAACVGANSRTLKQLGIPFLMSITHSGDHAGYYPGATMQAIKLLYRSEDGRLLGAQVVGQRAVDRTIDALAVAIQAGMSVYDLEHLELAYSPQYGSAKDPVNVAGYVAANRLRGDTILAEWSDLAALDPHRYGILDVRTQAEWEAGHIPGAVHIPNTQLRSRLGELSKDKEWIVYCGIGRRAYVMERMLRQRGYRVANLTGGWTTYKLATEPQSNLKAEKGMVRIRWGP